VPGSFGRIYHRADRRWLSSSGSRNVSRHAQDGSEQSERKARKISPTFGRQRGLLDDGLRAQRGDGRVSSGPERQDGHPLSTRGPQVPPTAVSCRTQVQPELHPRPRCGGGRGEPQPAAGEGLTPRMRFPPHESWTDAPRGPHEDERNLRRTRGDRPAPRGPRIRRPVRAPDPPTPNAAAMKASGPASLAPPPRRRRPQPSRLCLLEAAGGEQGRLKYLRPRGEM
jgi:hypothetical protein